MDDHTPEFIDKTRMWFETGLNEHGYSFQQSVLKLAQDLIEQGKSSWVFQVGEFPVEVRDKGTHVDFVLQRVLKMDSRIKHKDEQTTLMIAECKRANPAYSNWCFAKSPYLFRDKHDNMSPLIFERLSYFSDADYFKNRTDIKANASENIADPRRGVRNG